MPKRKNARSCPKTLYLVRNWSEYDQALVQRGSITIWLASAYALGGYTLPWWTANGGGGSSNGTGYQLSGTIGQPDAGPELSGGSYRLEGGFWGGVLSGEAPFKIYLPIVQKP